MSDDSRPLTVTEKGLACPAGGFFVDPRRPVPLAIVTHAHADHARPGNGRYVASVESVPLLRQRLGAVEIEGLAWGARRRLGEAMVSLHPAGHMRGSAQVRVELGGEVWVVSGDYKRASDPTCRRFEVVPCDTFVTEATFALPLYRWPSPETVIDELVEWWDDVGRRGRNAVLFCYAAGKAQRVLAELGRRTDRGVVVHGALTEITEVYREQGIAMVGTRLASTDPKRCRGELVLAPPSARRSSWMRRFEPYETGFASGWMCLRGACRRRGVDRGFVLSDHVDWPALVRTVDETGARRVLATHGVTTALCRFLVEERGLEAEPLVADDGGEA